MYEYITGGTTMEAVAHKDKYSIFPALDIMVTNTINETTVYRIQRPNSGMPGYYTYKLVVDAENDADHPISSKIVASYLPGELTELENTPETIVRTLIKTYVLLTMANLFSYLDQDFNANRYDNKDLPSSFTRAISKFVNLEYNQIMNK